jgi:hypothetical protein
MFYWKRCSYFLAINGDRTNSGEMTGLFPVNYDKSVVFSKITASFPLRAEGAAGVNKFISCRHANSLFTDCVYGPQMSV